MKRDDKVFFDWARKQYKKSDKYKEEMKDFVSLDGTERKIKMVVRSKQYEEDDNSKQNARGVTCEECTYPLDYGTQEIDTCYGLKYLCRSCRTEFKDKGILVKKKSSGGANKKRAKERKEEKEAEEECPTCDVVVTHLRTGVTIRQHAPNCAWHKKKLNND